MKLAGKLLLPVVFSLLFTGCATTKTGKGIELVKDNKALEALPILEEAAADGSKTAAIMASFLYLTDGQIPIDIEKAKHYYNVASSLDYGDGQYLDYFVPQVQARIMLFDDLTENDADATTILRGERYSEYPPSLRLLAMSYSVGKGVEKNLKLSKLLLERAMNIDDTPDSNHMYVWWLAVHPDEEFRDSRLAMELLPSILEDVDESNQANVWDTQAAVLAANGQYKEALTIQLKALGKLKEDVRHNPMLKRLVPSFECRLLTYQSQSPWHFEPGTSPFSKLYFHRCGIQSDATSI
ncbi:hypothetical protein BTA51_04040 [Hahella sp. CCB-MM4]|uniref:sel1 repeat family protein n=1 Tax=Hahella sp. (strain CCB-MM4) TaxID=1926491 RepID=UPI000BCE731C|nr:sel1 repeat family protein [Hahella sp. CCB-MM4]OZG74196.1 hypothetical protein BTA51_04040 [Hahella sp. CCB-MM4]